MYFFSYKFAALLKSIPPYLLTALCIAAICYLTLVPHPIPDNDLGEIPGMDKIIHAITFGGLTLCLNIDISRRHNFRQLSKRLLIITAVTATLFGGAIELLQNGMSLGRSADFYDFIADAAGAVLFAGLTPKFLRFLRR